MSPRLRSSLGFVACAALVLGCFAPLFATASVPIYRDLLYFTLPLKQFLADQLRVGEIPLWNPFLYMGTPSLGNPQGGALYPLSLLLLAPLPFGYDAFLVVHYLIAFSGAWCFLAAKGTGIPAAAVGALTYALGGYLVSTMSLTNHLQTAAWAPWVLYAASRLLERGTLGSLLLVSASIALQVVAGSAETLLMTLAITAGWVTYRTGAAPLRLVRVGLVLGIAFAFAAALAAAQILPALEYVRQSPRAAALSLREVTSWSLEPVSLIQLLVPHSGTLIGGFDTGALGPGLEQGLTWIQSIYIGVVPLCLLAVGCAYGAERRFWLAVLATSVVLALGSRTPVFAWLYDMLPALVGKFRYPEKLLFAAHLAAAVLAAEGFAALWSGNRDVRRLGFVVAGTFLTVAVACLELRQFAPDAYLAALPVLAGKALPATDFMELGLDFALKLARLSFLLIVWIALQRLQPRQIGEATFAALTALVVAFDLGTIHANLNLSLPWRALEQVPRLVDTQELAASHERIFHYQTRALDRIERRITPIAGLTRWLHDVSAAEDLRGIYVELWRALYVDVGMIYGVGVLSGADGVARSSDSLILKTLLELPREQAVALLRTYGVRYLIGPDPLNVRGLEEVTPSPPSPFRVYRIDDPCPMVAAVTRLREVRPTSAAARALSDPEFRCREEAILETLPFGWLAGSGASGGKARAELVRYEPSAVTIHAEADSQAFVVVNDSAFPGWRATVDGHEVEIHQTNAFVRGVVIPRGSHVVELRYRPQPVALGAGASVAAAVIALLAISRRRKVVLR